MAAGAYDGGTMAVRPKTHRFSVEDFQRMAASGILDEHQRVELLEGEVVEMTPIGSRHVAVVERAGEMFFRRFAGSAIVHGRSSVVISDLSQLQPDLALLTPRDDFYRASLAGRGTSWLSWRWLTLL